MSAVRVLVCNAGTLHLFPLARELDRQGVLATCATSIHLGEGTWRSLPPSLKRAAANRRCEGLDGKMRTHAFPEVVHLAAKRVGFAEAPLIAWRNRRFGAWVADRLLDGIDVVWGFDTASLEIFEAAKARGIRRVLDVTIPHPVRGNAILAEQASAQPEFGIGEGGMVPPDQIARRVREMDLADRLVVATPFVAETLAAEGIAPDRIRMNPYGVELEGFSAPPRSSSGPPAFVFVSWFTPRKGIYHLLDAWNSSKLAATGATLKLVGGDRVDLPHAPHQLPTGVVVAGRVPHAELPAVLATSDVFVFPSLLEGFGRVTLEAMASGLPVITTRNAAGAVVDGENGLVIPAGDVDALAGALRRLASDPALRARMGEASARLARTYTWQAYGERCAAMCRELGGAPR